MNFTEFPEVLTETLLFIGGYIGSNSRQANHAAAAIEAMTAEERAAFAEYRKAYTNTEILKGGFGANVYRMK